MTRFETINILDGNTELNGPGVFFNQVIWGRRDGIGRKVVQPGDVLLSSLETVYKYQGVKVTPGSYVNTPTNYFIQTYKKFIFATIRQKFKIGPTLTVGNILQINYPGHSATYTILLGDSVANVLTGIVNSVNAVSWGFSVTATGDGVNEMTIDASTLTAFTASLLHPSMAFFQTGYYIKSQVGLGSPSQWLIYSAQQLGSFPSVPSLAGSYNYSALTPLPFGISNYLYVPTYTPLAFSDTLQGTSTINNIPGGIISLSDDDLGYNPATNKIIAPTDVPFGVGERINIFYT